MICKVCGCRFKKSKKKVSICPSCGEVIFSQDQPKRKYNNNNSTNAQTHKKYSSTMPQKFRGFACSFEIDQNELKMSRFLNGGQFSFLGYLILFTMILIFVIPIALKVNIPPIFEPLGIIFIILFILFLIFVQNLTYSKIKVNSSGITIKTPLKKYFIPKEKIDFLDCKKVQRYRGDYEWDYEALYDLFIILKNKDKHFFNKIEIDTGLCYKKRIQVKYLVDKFNEYLGTQQFS